MSVAPETTKPKYASVLEDPDRVIFGADYLEDRYHPANRALPGIGAPVHGGYLPVDIAAHRVYESDDDGWIQLPTQRIAKKRARAEERRRERQGWLGSLTEPAPL